MASYGDNLPQCEDNIFITDGGLETVMVFHKQLDLPEFAAYDLLRDQPGYETLFDYYKTYVQLARQYGVGLVLETPTWRANRDWGKKIGDSAQQLREFNIRSVKLIEHIRQEYGDENTVIVISGCLGPRGDGYRPEQMMTAQQAREYHQEQIATFAQTNVDMVSAMTLNYIDEAVGVSMAAREHNLPVSISFTVETDGRLPTGDSLEQAITAVDRATDMAPAYYMINCAHPTHFAHLFQAPAPWHERIRGLRANASCLSHAELDEAETLDDGNPLEFGRQLGALKAILPRLTVLGGCCGTDHRHIEQICNHLN